MKIVLLIIWIIATLCLVTSIIGMILFIPPEGYRRSTWMDIGYTLIDSIIRECDNKVIKKF